MERWHEPLGRNFTANAEALATRALTKPLIDYTASYKTGFPCEQPNLVLIFPDAEISGWQKAVSRSRDAGTQVMIGTVATLLGASAAPVVALNQGTVFSPACMEPALIEDCADFSGLDPVSVGAAGQFRFWINDVDGEHNTVRSKDSDAMYLIDFEGAEPWRDRTTVSCERFIEQTLAQQNGDANTAYKAAATEMAARITGVTDVQLNDVAQTIRATGLNVPEQLVEGLVKRRALLQRPVYPQSTFDWVKPKFVR